MSFDLTGYEKHVPDESEIESVYYTFSGMTNVTTDDADTIRRLTAAHQAIVKNRNEQARIADAWDADTLSQSDHDDIEHFSLRLTYYLKDGSQLSRSYSLYLRRSDLTVPSSATARVNALYMCRESVLRRVLGYGCDHLGDTPRFLDSYCYYYDENSNTKDYALTAAQAEQVYAALMQDVQDSDNGGSDIFAVQEYQYDPPSFWLELYFESTNEKGRPEVYTLSPHVNGSTPNTLQVLNELLPELKSNTVTPPSDDGTSAIPANGTAASSGATADEGTSSYPPSRSERRYSPTGSNAGCGAAPLRDAPTSPPAAGRPPRGVGPGNSVKSSPGNSSTSPHCSSAPSATYPSAKGL